MWVIIGFHKSNSITLEATKGFEGDCEVFFFFFHEGSLQTPVSLLGGKLVVLGVIY